MNITQKSTLVSLLLLAAGCAHHERQTARYDENLNSRHYGAMPANSGSSATSSTTETTAAPSSSATIPSTSAVGDQGVLTEADGQLISKVQQAMNKDASLVPLTSSIQITAQNGTVTLSGTVPTEQDKQRLEMAAKSAPEVVSVNNQIQVSSQSTPAPTESSSVNPSGTGQNQPLSPTSQSTSSRIYTESQRTSPLPATDSSASTSDADSFSQKIQGISESDRDLAKQLGQQLKADSSMATMMSDVKIDLSDGKATLRGHVSSEDEKSKIEDAVKQVSGVNSVDNQIQVNSALNQGGTQPKQD
jgi:osmotically-inducible protein OsmY